MTIITLLIGCTIGGFIGAAFVAGRGRPCQWCDEVDE